MKYYSEVTKKLYDSEADLKKAEDVINNKAAARKRDAEAVENAYKAYLDAKKKYEDVLAEFCKKYGAYHKTVSNADELKEAMPASLSQLIDLLF